MNFEDEEYVRLYKPDTVTIRKIGWEGRTVLWHIMRKVDKGGILDLEEGDDLVESVAALCDIPEDIVRIGLDRLASRGVTARHGHSLLLTKFVEAQNARRSDRLRAQDYRDRKRAEAESASPESSKNTEENGAPSREVTAAHETPSPVTIRHSLPPLSPSPALPPPASPERAGGLAEVGVAQRKIGERPRFDAQAASFLRSTAREFRVPGFVGSYAAELGLDRNAYSDVLSDWREKILGDRSADNLISVLFRFIERKAHGAPVTTLPPAQQLKQERQQAAREAARKAVEDRRIEELNEQARAVVGDPAKFDLKAIMATIGGNV